MQFLSVYFIVFLAVAAVGFACCRNSWKPYFLLACNLIFYISWMRKITEILPLAAITALTYGGAVRMGRRKSGAVLAFVASLSLGVLLYFKYIDFLIANWNAFGFPGMGKLLPVHPMAPIGISFFTFQALGYVIDVYRGNTAPERNFIRYFAYVSFFPVITSGPIERSGTLLSWIRNPESGVSPAQMRRGVILFLHGAFIKLVISDRLAVIVNTVFDHYHAYGGMILLFAAVGYTMQIYCDFSSYSLLALGISSCMGFQAAENFKAPYFSETIREFWRRWHISLSSWFRDYLYIPLGGSRCSAFRRNLNLMLTFLASGAWHGADWTFLFWGGLHGLYQVIGNVTQPLREWIIIKFGIRTDCFSFRWFRKLFIFSLVSFAWIFFRSETLADAFQYIAAIFTRTQPWQLFDGTLYNLGLDRMQSDILLFSLLFFSALDYQKYRTDRNLDALLSGQNCLFRYAVITALFLASAVFGIYGPEFNAQEFIYFRF